MSRSVGDRSFEVSYRDFVEILDMAIKVSKLGGVQTFNWIQDDIRLSIVYKNVCYFN